MDQPGYGHFALHLSQQILNGLGDHRGRAGNEGKNARSASGNGNGRPGSGKGPKGFSGLAPAPSSDQRDKQGNPDQRGHDEPPQGPREYVEYTEYAEYIEAGATRQDDGAAQGTTAAEEDSAGQGAGAGHEDSAGQGASADGIAAQEGIAADGAGEDSIPADRAIQDGALAGEGTGTGDAGGGWADDDRDMTIHLVPPQSGSYHDDDFPPGAMAPSSAADRMRELLARTTAGQAGGDQATAAAVEDVRRRLAGLAAAIDGVSAGLSTVSTQLAAADGRLTGIDSRLASSDAKHVSIEGRVSALDTRFERLDERLDDQYDRVASIDNRLAAAGARVSGLADQFAQSLPALGEEVRARPARTEIEELVTKIVGNAHTDLATRLASLEDTMLTLTEALLHPAPGHTPPEG